MKRKLYDILLGLLPLAVLLPIWEFVIASTPRGKFLFASPSLIVRAFKNNFPILADDLWITGIETLLGFIAGNLVGIGIGLSLWYSDRSARLVRPYVIAIGAIPIFAISPMMIIWFGTGLFAKAMMAAISTVTIAITQSYEGARNIDPGQINLFRSFRASNVQIFRKLVLPASLIWVFNSLRLNVTLALLGAFIGEFISSDRGLGHRIFQAGGLYDIPLVLAAVVCIICLAFLLNALIWIFQRKWLSWK